MNHFTSKVQPLLVLFKIFGHYPDGNTIFTTVFLYLYSLFLPNFCFFVAVIEKYFIITKWEVILLSWYGIQIFFTSIVQLSLFAKTKSLVAKLDQWDISSQSKLQRLWLPILIIDYLVIYSMNMYTTNNFKLRMFLKCFAVTLLHTRAHVQLVIFVMLCSEIIQRAKLISTQNIPLEELRLEHLKLISCVESLNSAYGFKILVNVLFYGTDTLVNLYVFVYHKNDWGILTLWLSFIDFTPLYIISVISPTVIREIHHMREKLLVISTTGKSKVYCEQLELFMDQLNNGPTKLTAWSIFPLNFGLFGYFANTILTFFIAMAQFSQNIREMIDKYKMNTL